MRQMRLRGLALVRCDDGLLVLGKVRGQCIVYGRDGHCMVRLMERLALEDNSSGPLHKKTHCADAADDADNCTDLSHKKFELEAELPNHGLREGYND